MDNQRLLQQVQELTQENQALLGEKNQLQKNMVEATGQISTLIAALREREDQCA